MPAINLADLQNAKTDVDHIAALANVSAPAATTATDRLGQVKKTWAGFLADLQAQNDAAIGAASGRVTFISSYAGADPTGITPSDAALASAIASGKKTIIIPDNSLYSFTTSVTLPQDVSLVGYGWQSRLRWLSNAKFITLGLRSHVRDLCIIGEDNISGKSAQVGLYADGNTNWVIDGVMFVSLAGQVASGGGAIVVTNTHSANFGGGQIIRPFITNCYDGITLISRGEYVQIVAPHCTQNLGRGIYTAAGNFTIDAPKCTLNAVGIEVDAGVNDSHASITGGNVNHNTKNLKVGAIANGLDLVGTQLHAGDIEINGATGVDFVGCAMASGTLTLTGTCVVAARGGRIAPTMTQVLNGNAINQTATPLSF